jgi:hypothetical protein
MQRIELQESRLRYAGLGQGKKKWLGLGVTCIHAHKVDAVPMLNGKLSSMRRIVVRGRRTDKTGRVGRARYARIQC